VKIALGLADRSQGREFWQAGRKKRPSDHASPEGTACVIPTISKEARHAHDHDHRWHGNLLQRLGETAGHYWPMTGTSRCCSFSSSAFASSPMTGAATAAPARPRRQRHGPLCRRCCAALTEHLDLHNAVHVGHSTGGGEVVRYLGRHGESRVAKAVLISSVPPLMVKTARQSGGASQGSVRRISGATGDQSPAVLS